VSRDEYTYFSKKGLSDYFITEAQNFINKNPSFEKHIDNIDNMYNAEYAKLIRNEEGYCRLLDDNRLCSIYNIRPHECRVYKTNMCEAIRCISLS
jgi:Fe-S-cluster containining protein